MNKLIIVLSLMTVMMTSCGGNKSKSEDTAGLAETTDMVEAVLHDSSKVKAGDKATETGEVVIYTDLVSNGLPTIVDFTATWCPPCRMMKPIFHKLAGEYGKKFNFVAIDIDERPDLAQKYGIQAVPTFVFLNEEGVEGNRINGAVSEEEFRQELDNPVWY